MLNTLPYLICFSSSCAILWFAQKIRKGQCEPIRWFFYFVAILIPSILAGVRDYTVGIDVLFYAKPVFDDIRTSPSLDKISSNWDGWIDIGYLWLNYIFIKLSNDFNLFLFFISFTIISFVFLGLHYWRRKLPIWLGMFVFYCFFYNQSLNALRQMLSLSIVMFATINIFKGNMIRYLILVLVASLFHKSSLLTLSFYPIYCYSTHYTSSKAKIALIFGGTVLLFLSLLLVMQYFSEITSVFSELHRVFWYIAPSETDNRIPYKALFYIFFAMFVLWYKRRFMYESFSKNGHFFITLMLIISALNLLPLFAPSVVARFIDVFSIFLIIIFPAFSVSLRLPKIKRAIVNIMIISYCLIRWYVSNFIYTDGTGTDKYSSQILSVF